MQTIEALERRTLFSDGTEGWSHQYSTEQSDGVVTPAFAPDGTIYAIENDNLMHLKADGSVLWRITVKSNDLVNSVSVSSTNHVYVSGSTYIDGEGSRPFVARYDTAGQQQWRQLLDVKGDAAGRYATVDAAENIYVVGSTIGGPLGFIQKLKSDGSVIWTRALDQSAYRIALDGAGNPYIAGNTAAHAYAARLSPADGSQVWSKSIASASLDQVFALAVDSVGNVYVGGHTQGTLGAAKFGDYDAFVRRYTSAGNVVWTQQFGTPAYDVILGLGVDPAGNVYFGGATNGNWLIPSTGYDDMIVGQITSGGAFGWKRQRGTAGNEWSGGVAVDSAGTVLVGGITDAQWFTHTPGGYDSVILQYVTSGIQALGNGLVIKDGDTTASPDDGTDFGTIAAGDSAYHVFTIRNTSKITATLSNLRAVQPDGNPSPAFSGTEPLSMTLAPGQSGTFTVRFRTVQIGSFNRTLLFDNSISPGNPYHFAVHGTTVVSPAVIVSSNFTTIANNDSTPSTLDNTDFGKIAPGGVVTRTFRVSTVGSSTVTTADLRVTQLDGSSTSAFSVIEPLNAAIEPGSSDTFTIRFSTTVLGTFDRIVRFTTNDPYRPTFSFTIRGAVQKI